MSEKRFVIKEVPPTGAPHDFSITESEFKKRIQAIDLLNDLDECVDILTHGEEEQPPAGLFHGPGLPIRDMDGDLIFPPKPTRKEWEEWVELFVEFSGFGLSRVGLQNLTEIMLSMPIVPKEDE
jgi:hypothetical protein